MLAKINTRFESWRFIALVAIALSTTAVESRADVVILDTFATDGSVQGTEWFLRNLPPNPASDPPFPGAFQSLAVFFSVPSTVTTVSVGSISTSISGGGGPLQVGVMAGSSSKPSNIFLFSTTVTTPITNLSITNPQWTLGPGNYWLAAMPGSGFDGTWQAGGDSIGLATSDNGAFWGFHFVDTPAARIIVSSIPEPEIYAMMLAGLGLVGWAVRRKRGQVA